MTAPSPAVPGEVAVELAALGAVEQAAVLWGMPLLDILNRHGHDADCDALAADNLTLCDCWWGEVKRAAEVMSVVATAATDSIAALKSKAASDE